MVFKTCYRVKEQQFANLSDVIYGWAGFLAVSQAVLL
jgi:hypothetical protein